MNWLDNESNLLLLGLLLVWGKRALVSKASYPLQMSVVRGRGGCAGCNADGRILYTGLVKAMAATLVPLLRLLLLFRLLFILLFRLLFMLEVSPTPTALPVAVGPFCRKFPAPPPSWAMAGSTGLELWLYAKLLITIQSLQSIHFIRWGIDELIALSVIRLILLEGFLFYQTVHYQSKNKREMKSNERNWNFQVQSSRSKGWKRAERLKVHLWYPELATVDSCEMETWLPCVLLSPSPPELASGLSSTYCNDSMNSSRLVPEAPLKQPLDDADDADDADDTDDTDVTVADVAGVAVAAPVTLVLGARPRIRSYFVMPAIQIKRYVRNTTRISDY